MKLNVFFVYSLILLIENNVSFLLCYLPSLNVGRTPPELTPQIPVDQMAVGGAESLHQNTRQIHKGGPP